MKFIIFLFVFLLISLRKDLDLYFPYFIAFSCSLVNVPYSVQELGPRTLITNELVSSKKVPGGVVTKDVLTNTSLIVGKYVSNKAVIPEGGMFFKSMVVSWDDLPKGPAEDIGKGEALVHLKVSMNSTFGNSIFPGNYIDLYYRLNDPKTGKIWIGKFIESIRVLDVIDQNSNSVFETIGTPRTPDKLLFAVPEEMYYLFTKISMLNIELFPVQRNADYSKTPSEMKITGNEFKQYVESQAVSDDIINGGK